MRGRLEKSRPPWVKEAEGAELTADEQGKAAAARTHGDETLAGRARKEDSAASSMASKQGVVEGSTLPPGLLEGLQGVVLPGTNLNVASSMAGKQGIPEGLLEGLQSVVGPGTNLNLANAVGHVTIFRSYSPMFTHHPCRQVDAWLTHLEPPC